VSITNGFSAIGKQTLLPPTFLGRVGRSSASLLLARLVTQVQLALFTVLAARRLGEAGFGQYAFIASVIFIGNVITTFGTDTLLIREIARTRATDILTSAFWIQVVLSALFIGGAFVWTGYLPNKMTETLVGLKLYSLSLVPLAFFSIYSAVLRAYERMDLYLVVNLFSALLQVGGAWLILKVTSGLLPLLLLLLVVQACIAMLSGVLCHRCIPNFSFRWRVSWSRAIEVLRAAWPLALVSILSIIYQRMGTLMVSFLGGDALTGWFSAGWRVLDAARIAHLAVLGTLLPVLSSVSHDDHGKAQSIFRRSVILLMVLAVALAVMVARLAAPLVLLLFGANYAPTSAALQVLSFSLIPYTLTASFSLRLVVQRQERRVLLVTAVSLAATVALYRWLIPVWGLIGAGLAAVAGECFQALAFLLLERANE